MGRLETKHGFRKKPASGKDWTTGRYGMLRAVAIISVLGVFVLLGCSSGGSSGNTTDDSSNSSSNSSSSSSSSTATKTGAYEQDGGTKSETGVTYTATDSDESGVYVYGGGTYNLTNGTVEKTGGDTSSGDNSNFYGLNAIVLAEDQSTINLSGCTLDSTTEGSNGAFAYGEGSKVTLTNCTITTTANSSRGVDATYGGSIDISNSTISTQGDHCAALASDRYENNNPPGITADNVDGTTAGDGSPGIYSTGTFNVSNSDLMATGSEAAGIEGFNSITLTDTAITGYKKWGVIVYQSTSGDSTAGTGTFNMTGGSLTNNSSGPVFMVCNTAAIINLNSVAITTSGSVLIRATDSSSGDSNINADWGSAGGDVTFTATDQTLAGTISINSLSSLDMTLSGTTTLSGDVEDDGGEVDITLDGSSAKWTATATSHVSSLDGIRFSGSTPTNVDAASGVIIYYGSATDDSNNSLTSTYTLASGGTLQMN